MDGGIRVGLVVRVELKGWNGVDGSRVDKEEKYKIK